MSSTRYFPALFVILWSTGFIAARLGMPYAQPLSFLTIRYIMAIIILGGLALLARAHWPGWRLAAHSMVVGVLLHGIYLGAVFWSIDHGLPAAIAAMIVGLQPIMVALLANSIFGESISRRHWVGLFIGVLGLVFVLAPKFGIGDSGITMVNVLTCILAMFGATFGTIYQKKFATGVQLRTGTFWQYVGALIPSMLLALFIEDFTFVWNTELIFALFWAVLVLSIGAIFLLMMLIRQGSVAKVSSLLFLVPASTAILAFFLFGETLTLPQLFGMVLCAAAVRLAMKPAAARRRLTRPAETPP